MARSISSRSTAEPGWVAASGSASTRSRIAGSAMKPHLTTSASPLISSLRGSVSSVARSQSTPDGSWNAPTRFLPSLRVHPGLAARRPRRPSPAASSGRARPCTPRSQVAATKPPMSVVAPPPTVTTASLRVKPVCAEHLPAERRHRRELRLLAVRDLDAVRVVPLAGQVRPGRLAGRGQRARVDHRDATDAVAEHARQLVEQPAADDHVVRRGAAHVQHGAVRSPVMPAPPPARPAAATSAATSSGVRPSVSTVIEATSR